MVMTHEQGASTALESGPTVGKLYKMMVEVLADRAGVPRSYIYREALDMLAASVLDSLSVEDLRDFFGKRADELWDGIQDMAVRGSATTAARKRRGLRRA